MGKTQKRTSSTNANPASTVEPKPETVTEGQKNRPRKGLIRADELPPVPEWMRKPPGETKAGLFDAASDGG